MKQNQYILKAKIILTIFSICGIYVLVMIVLGTYQLFGNGVISMIIGLPVLIFNGYVYYEACIYVFEKFEEDLEKIDKMKK